MEKVNDTGEFSQVLSYLILDPAAREQLDDFTVEEFGIIAREAVNPDFLTKHVGRERNASKTIDVYLCYNWKRAIPFVVKETTVEQRNRSYTPQYGREDNYPESVIWRARKIQLYSSAEFSKRHPEIAAIF